VGFATQGDDEVDIAQKIEVDGRGCLVGDVDADFGERLRRQLVDPAPRLGASRMDVTESPAILRISPAAIWDLPAFLTQTNNTDGGVEDSVIVAPP
jgi:hypothetical protein